MRRASVVRVGAKAVLLGGLAACSGGDSPTQPNRPPAPSLQTVTVALPATSLAAGSSQVATASAKYSNDSTVVPTSVAWTSTNHSVAGVGKSGNVIAVGVGTDTIVATVAGVSGQAVLTVSEAPPLAAGIVALAIKPGAVQSFPLDGSVTGYQIPALADSSNYIFIVADADTAAFVKKSFGITMDSGSVMASSTSTTPVASPSRNVPPSRDLQLAGASDIEGHIRDFERHNLPRLGGNSLVRKSLNVPRASSTHDYAAGDVVSIKVPEYAQKDLCNTYATVGTKVFAVSNKAIILMDTTVAVDPSFTTTATLLAKEFDTNIYPTDTKYFGTPSDIDGNGKVMIVLTPEINKLTPKDSVRLGYIAGFFFAGDLYPTASCKSSNLGEIFYMLAPDPKGIYGGVQFSASLIAQTSRGTIAHEFQHMINAGHRIAINAPFETSWLDEGLAHLAEDLVGRSLDTLSATERATRTNVGANKDNYNAFFFENLARYTSYLNATGTTGATADASNSLAVRGAAWSLIRNTADVYFGSDISVFTNRLENVNKTGVYNFIPASGVSFQTAIGSWAVANAYSILKANGTQSYVSYDFADLIRFSSLGTSLMPKLSAGINTPSTVLSADARYFQVTTTGASVPQTVHLVSGSGTGAAVIPTSRLYMLRIQ